MHDVNTLPLHQCCHKMEFLVFFREVETQSQKCQGHECHHEALLTQPISPMRRGSSYFPPAGFLGAQAYSVLPSLTGSKGSVFTNIPGGVGPCQVNLIYTLQ